MKYNWIHGLEAAKRWEANRKQKEISSRSAGVKK